MNNKERMDLAKWASNLAIKKGAAQSAVSVSRSRNVQVEVREQRVETIRESTDNGLNIQIFYNQRYSSHSTNNLNKAQLERFISEAVAATAYLSPDEDRLLPDASLYPTDLKVDLKLTDPRQREITPEFRLSKAMETEQLLRDGYPELLSASASFSDNASEGVRVHSNGFEGHFANTRFSTSASLTVLDKGSRPAGSFWASTRFLSDLPDSNEIASKALFDTTRQLGQTQIQSGRYNMLLDSRIVGNFIFRMFQPMAARNIQQRNSFLLDKIDEQIGSEQFTLIDNPLLERGMASRLFDGEGIAAKPRTMIENGILKSYYIDNYYGRKLGWTPNGGSPSNIIMKTGSRSQQELIAGQNKAILVTSFNGGNANATTGDFSFGISGQLIENGIIVRPVNEMNITGSFRSFWHQLLESGNDPYPYSSVQSPTLVVRDIDFSGL